MAFWAGLYGLLPAATSAIQTGAQAVGQAANQAVSQGLGMAAQGGAQVGNVLAQGAEAVGQAAKDVGASSFGQGVMKQVAPGFVPGGGTGGGLLEKVAQKGMGSLMGAGGGGGGGNVMSTPPPIGQINGGKYIPSWNPQYQRILQRRNLDMMFKQMQMGQK